MRKLLTALALAIGMVAVPAIAAEPASANHITSYDCEVNDEHRSSGGISVGIRWSNSDVKQKMVQLAIGNSNTLPYEITARYQRFTDGHVYKTQDWIIPSNSQIPTWISGNGNDWDGTTGHSQVYHAGIKIYRDGAYLFSINLWYSSYRGTVTFRAKLTNCTPQVSASSVHASPIRAALLVSGDRDTMAKRYHCIPYFHGHKIRGYLVVKWNVAYHIEVPPFETLLRWFLRGLHPIPCQR